MTSIELTSITGITPPYVVYACDVYGAFCIPIATVSTFVPPSNTIILPPAFAFAPAVGIKIIGSGCERFEIYYCTSLFPEHVCLEIKSCFGGPLCPIYNAIYLNFTIDENINGKPSWIGTLYGVPYTLYWDGTQWVIIPAGITNSGPDLNFGLWYSLFGLTVSLFNSYCPSICILLYDGSTTDSYFLQFQNFSGVPFYEYDDGILQITVTWSSLNNRWELEINSVLIATYSLVDDTQTPLGVFTLEPAVPYVNITTVLECPSFGFKQFQNDEYFYFMDSDQYNFQN